MTKIGHHRSLALAERHRRTLGEGWEIKSRRNAAGRYSSRGHTFEFEKKEAEVQEYVLYWQKQKRGRTVFPKVHIIIAAPPRQTRKTIISGVEQWSLGQPQAGWSIRAISLHGKEYSPDEVRFGIAGMINSDNFEGVEWDAKPRGQTEWA